MPTAEGAWQRVARRVSAPAKPRRTARCACAWGWNRGESALVHLTAAIKGAEAAVHIVYGEPGPFAGG